MAALDAVVNPETVTALRWVVFASSGGSGSRRASTARPPRSPAAGTAPAPPSTPTLNSRTAPRLEEGCLLVGTSTGHVQVHAERSSSGRASPTPSSPTPSGRGRLLHRQRVHAGPIVSLRLRPAGAGLDPVALDDDISVTAPDAVARLAAVEARAVCQAAAGGGGGAPDWRARRLAPLPLPLGVQRWDLGRGVGPRTDGIVLGPRLPRLRDALDGRDGGSGGGGRGGPGRLVILSAGAAPAALAAHDAAEHAPRGTAALVADLAASVAAGLLGAARAALAGREGGLRAGIRGWVAARASSSTPGGARLGPPGPRPAPDAAGEPPSRPASAASSRPSSEAPSPAATPGRPSSAGWAAGAAAGAAVAAGAEKAGAPPPPAGEPAALWRAFADPSRRITALHPAPTGALAAAADALGRILLVDGADGCRVTRVWKGYRGAQLAWVQLSPPSAAASAAASPATAAALTAAAAYAGEAIDTASLLVLVAYAPRRGVVEGWCPRTGARLGVARVGSGAAAPCCLVSPDAVLGLGGGRGVPGGVGPRDAWVVDGGSGVVTSVVSLMERGWREIL